MILLNVGLSEFEKNKIVEVCRKASEGDADAQYRLGERCSIGDGVKESDEVAVGWYKKAAHQGHLDAQFELAKAYLEGDGVEEDGVSAAYWFLKAAHQGDIGAQWMVGMFYGTGNFLEKNTELGVYWINEFMKQSSAIRRKGESKVVIIDESFFQPYLT